MREELKMNNEDIIKDFINMGRAIYTAAMEANEDMESPDSLTISATTNDNKKIEIEITISIKDGE
jgi:hypothetical protein